MNNFENTFNSLSDELQIKLQALSDIVLSAAPLGIALSGGVDSTFLLGFSAKILGDKLTGFTASGSIFAPDEIAFAKVFCDRLGIKHFFIPAELTELPEFCTNPKDRCYGCKKFIFTNLLEKSKALGIKTLADGTNADDALDYRPGGRAIAELKILSPLKEAGLTKSEIRQALKAMNIEIWNKPAFACLASRIPYGEAITKEKLESIYALEKFLRDLGFAQVRVRHHGEVARIEVLPEDRIKFFDTALMDRINEKAKSCGFTFASLDLGGYRMGNLN